MVPARTGPGIRRGGTAHADTADRQGNIVPMKSARAIACVGLSDDEAAHLRLLARLGSGQLDHAWTWVNEADAGLLVADPAVADAALAINRALSAGRLVAVVADADAVVVHGLVLRRPFKLTQIAAVLNAAGRSIVDDAAIVHASETFYTAPLAQDDADDAPAAPAAAADVAAGLDELIKGDPLVEPPPPPRVELHAGLVEFTGDGTGRSAWKAQQADTRLGQVLDAPDGPSVIDLRERAPQAPAGATHGADDGLAFSGAVQTSALASDGAATLATQGGLGLRELIERGLIFSPSRRTLEDGRSLILDPKQELFHSPLDLSALGDFVLQQHRREDWQAITTGQLALARSTEPGKPFRWLFWLQAVLDSQGRLAGHLDPAGTYALRGRVDVDDAFHAHGAVCAAMREPMRLHEIARSAGADMGQVFDLVNAYDSIGLLDWKPRQRGEPPAPAPEPAGSLLSRMRQALRKPR